MRQVTKVIHINDNIRLSGGAEVYLEQLARLSAGCGWETDWLSVQRVGRRVAVLRHGHSGWFWNGEIKSLGDFLCGELRTSENALLHVHNISDPRLTSRLFDLAPVVRTMHDPRMFCPGQGKFWNVAEVPCERPFGIHCLWHAYSQRCCNRHPKRLVAGVCNARFEVGAGAARYAVVIANSRFMKRQAILAGMPEGRIAVLPCFTQEVPALEANLLSQSRQVLFAGRLTKTKGVHLLLRAFALLRHELPDATLAIAGEGMDRDFFVNLANALGIHNAVTFHGWCARDKVNALIQQSSVIAFPSICPEAFGMGGIEAMMHGRPVVAFDAGGVREWLQDGVTGMLVRPKDINAFAAAMSGLLATTSLCAAMGKAARAAALRDFTPTKHLERLRDLYNAALSRGR